MSTQTNPAPAGQGGEPPKLAIGQAFIRGRITSMRRARGQRVGWLTVLVMPAPDEFTSPSTVEVFSREQIGQAETMWRGVVTIGGYRRSYPTDQEDGHGGTRRVTVQTADNTLTVVEA